MKLTFIGAAHEVTGSCYLLEACNKKIIIDCGLEQGRDTFVNQDIPVKASDIDMVLLTHAHIDHSGKLPMLFAQGFSGPIYATGATSELCDIMLRDSAHIQESDAEWEARKAKRAGREPEPPLYTMDDAIGTIGLLVPCLYEKMVNVAEGLDVRFVDAGHLLGSASIEIFINENGIRRKVVFSGDIGNLAQPILKDPHYIDSADYVVMESTYGDRSHAERTDRVTQLAGIIQRTFDRGGNLVIPSFAVGRTQEMLYLIREIKARNLIKGHDNFRVIVDSPLAINATKVFKLNFVDCFDRDTMALLNQGINPLEFDGLELTVTTDESKAINFDDNSKVIISASGMCEAGRIRHHLKHNLWREQSTILFVGYQAEGTIGRQLMEGALSVKLFGETIKVRAEIAALASISGHADNEGLMKWASSFKEKPTRIFVTHGDESVCEVFTERLKSELGVTAVAPYSGECWDLESDRKLSEGVIKRVERGGADRSSPFAKLIAACKNLLNIAEANEGLANKELARFTADVTAVSQRWKR